MAENMRRIGERSDDLLTTSQKSIRQQYWLVDLSSFERILDYDMLVGDT